ncbi:hypothetical protein, conserved [Babesia ovata]|uniref:Extracellular matrix-binding ebh n=1 Tax=Babesia ovata TaxID=189622 RepID=A0A2H6KKL2_9APIC|nr:uncharacterized protein BOVATA_050270 [Babesia ovata]GBE63534.1 hypothetical protein, conserved [Babesia ovata]
MKEKALKDIDTRRISLGKLAGQLSGFIGGGEEVKNAIIKGLQSNVNQLEKLLKTSCGDKGCNCNIKKFRDENLKNLQKQFNDIDEIATKIDSLKKQKDVAEKRKAPVRAPPGGDPEIEKQIDAKTLELEQQKNLVEKQIKELEKALSVPKSKIESEISNRQKSVAELDRQIEAERKRQIDDFQKQGYDAEKAKKYVSIPYHLSNSLETEQAKLMSHEASLESLESLGMLITFHQSVQTPQSGECENILDKLCTGLQTFLGYNETSKGYDGTGIVYSDLDRLCDGVMAFLHGVLKDVNDNPNLQKYNTDLPNVLQKIKEALYNRDNFDSSIRAVSEGIKQWVSGVDGKHRTVTAPLGNLKITMDGHIKAHMDRMPITEQLRNWQGFAGLYLGEVQKSEKALKNIDDNLGIRVSPYIEFIREIVENFRKSVNDESVTNSVKALNAKFMYHRKDVASHIETKIQTVKQSLSEKLGQIGKDIETLKQARDTHIKSIRNAMKLAQQAADNLLGKTGTEFDTAYKTLITNKFTEIKEAIEKFAKKDSGTTPLQTNFKTVQSEVGSLEEKVRKDLENLRKQINDVTDRLANDDVNSSLVSEQLSQLEDAKKKLLKVTGTKESSDGDEGNLEKLFEDHIKNKLSELVKNVDEKIVAIGKYFGGGKTIEACLSNIKKKVIEESETALNGGSNQIVSKYHKCVDNYITNYEKTVNLWVNEFVNTMELARTIYIDVIGTGGQWDWKNITQAIEAGKQRIIQIVKGFGVKANLSADDVEATLRSVKSFLDQGPSKIDQEGSVTEVAGIIETKATSGKNTNNQHLISAIKAIFGSICAKASAASKDIQTLIEEPNISNLKQALTTAPTLVAKLGMVDAKSVDAAIDALKSEIDSQLMGKFRNSVKNGLEGAVNMFHADAKEQLKDAAEKAIETAAGKFTTVSGDANKINVKAMMSEFETSRKAIEEAVDIIDAEIRRLKKVPAIVEQTGNNAGELMDELKGRIDGIKKAIDAIAKPINDAEDAFDSAVEALDGSLVLAQSAANGKLQDLQFDLQARVNKALHDLEDAVQKMYDDQKKAELRALHSSVADQFSNVRSLIDDDMDMGLKGLMGKLKEAFLVYRPYPSGTDLRPFTKKVNQFLTKFFDELLLQTDLTDDRERMDPLTSALSSLLSTMFNKQHFHREVSDKIDALKKALDNFTPTQFHEASPLLNVVKRGVTDLHEQLRKQYVSRYSGKEWNSLQEPEKTNCAQILVTILKTLTHDLRELHERCDKKKGDCRENKISLISKPSVYNPLGAFFKDCGFIVSKLEESYEGELRCHEQMRGGDIYSRNLLLRCKMSTKFYIFRNALQTKLITSLSSTYLNVSQLTSGHCDKMLNQKDEATGAFPNQADKVMKRSLQHLYGTIKKTCHLSHRLLVSIQGNGRGYDHAAYPYACCFENNHGGFYYPGDPSSLLDMLKDMCMRLLRAVSFLYQQCKHTASDGNGWRECQYGYRVGTYHWDCDKSSDDSNTQPNRQPKCQPNSEPNDQPTCLPKSPLQAHLMDGLPGFMPHKFTAVGCQAMCSTCPKGSLIWPLRALLQAVAMTSLMCFLRFVKMAVQFCVN